MKTYIFGGTVRDQLLGVKPKDLDIAVEIESFDRLREFLLNEGYFICKEKQSTLAIRAKGPEGVGDWVVCHDKDKQPADIYAFLSHRDFTMGAMAIDCQTNELLDPYNGKDDLFKYGLITAVGEARDRFTEDPIRMLRAVRLAVTKNLEISYQVETAIKEMKHLLRTLDPNPIREELARSFKYNTIDTLRLLEFLRLYETLFDNELSIWLKPTTER